MAQQPGGFGQQHPMLSAMAQQPGGFGQQHPILSALAQQSGDPIASQWSQQQNPLYQQQLPIRPLIGGQQGIGSQTWTPGMSPTAQPVDPYRTFVEAQLISQLVNNPLYQLQRAFAGVPETGGMGMPFGMGQQFNPPFANAPFYG